MTMSDPIADMLTRLRNANVAMHDTVRMPCSKLKAARPGSILEIQMKYSVERDRAIAGIKRVSTPGLRVYARADRLPRVLGGMGVAVLSTSRGLMTDREARKNKVGGEVLCYVW